MRRFAPAKVNLYLHVGERRPDGYHDLASLVVFADAGDWIEARPAKDFALHLSGPFAPALASDPGNIILSAARALQLWANERGHAAPPVELSLEKNLPVASGIGGGSSDAAATLHLLKDFWSLPASPEDLASIGVTLGADVPMCLLAESALASGIGEILSPVHKMPDCAMVLVNPMVPVATASVFRNLHARSGAFQASLPRVMAIRTLSVLLDHTMNDLAAPAKIQAPVIMRVEQALVTSPGCLVARMSGSGATCYGLFATMEEADAAAGLIAKAWPQWWVTPCRLFRAAAQ